MGNLLPDGAAIGHLPHEAPPDGAFEAPEDLNYDRMIADRERELGLPQEPAPRVSGAAYAAPVARYEPPYRMQDNPSYTLPDTADLSPLPDRFELVIERKPSGWKVTSPLHVGLWRAGEDLAAVIKEGLAALATMIAIDGPQPKTRKRNAPPLTRSPDKAT